ncbi:hypothetical protein ACFYR1_06010 [Streptomyces canus]|uniref:hypothetical protein n=1 Tax=Streptomyces canus TaxID=58343 RepID=UPI0036A430F3
MCDPAPDQRAEQLSPGLDHTDVLRTAGSTGQGALIAVMRSAGWAVLAVLLSVILTPPRVSAQDGGLDVRGR